MILEKIQNEWKTDSEIDHNALDIESTRTGVLHGKYLEHYNNAKLSLITIENEYSALVQLKWRWYHKKMSREEIESLNWDYDPFDGETTPLKADIKEYYLDKDKDLIRLQNKIEYYKIVIDTARQILDILKWRHQNIKNIIEFRKFVSGGG